MSSAQEAATLAYRDAEKRLRQEARESLLAGDRATAMEELALAHHLGMEFIRNHIGERRDRWELAGTPMAVRTLVEQCSEPKDGNEPRDGMWR